jgi:type IV secretion system protein VirB6
MACGGVADGAYLSSVLGFVDCQAQSIATYGFQAAAQPGSTLSLLLTALLTIFIAIWGYRLILGGIPGMRDGVVSVLQIGLVLTLATSWAAYRTLAYDLVLHGPAELASTIGTPAGLPGADGGLIGRLQGVDDSLIRLNAVGAGPTNMATRMSTANGTPTAITVVTNEPPTMFGPFALGTARVIFLSATIASFVSIRIAAGILLAVGPFFALLLLFGMTRSLFEGWVRGLVATMLGALGVSILLGVELALLEPWLATLIAKRQAGMAISGAPSELMVTMLAFGLALIGMLGMAARVALGFRFGAIGVAAFEHSRDHTHRTDHAPPSFDIPSRATPIVNSRATAIVEAVARIDRHAAQHAPASAGQSRFGGNASTNALIVGNRPADRGARRVRQRTSRMAAQRDAAR